jgi:putative phosphotransacetylase
MEKEEAKRLVTLTVCVKMAEQKQYYIPAAVSARHIHLSAADRDSLFGSGYALHPMRPLSQPGQFACEEKLAIVGPKDRIEGVRILGPERPETQVEVSMTDTMKLGIAPMVRMSGDIAGTPGCKLVGPKGELTIGKGGIVASRHLHMSAQEAAAYGLKNGDIVSVRKNGVRGITLHNIAVRAGDEHSLELHIDTDEANAAAIQSGDLLELAWER